MRSCSDEQARDRPRLGADSAATLGDGKKIYQTAEKLFSVSPSIPVAIMICGSADMMGVPRETIIKVRRTLHPGNGMNGINRPGQRLTRDVSPAAPPRRILV